VSVPSRMPVRQFPRAIRTRVRIAYAVAWETLLDSHATQARQFIGEFASRMTPLEALELYLSVVPIAATMLEAVRTRTLASLELDDLPPRQPIPTLRGWRVLRLDLLLKLLRFRRAYEERTLELARMVGARAAEAVTATHVKNAHDLAELLEGYVTVERAVEEYQRAFYLSLATGQAVMQRVKATLAGSHLAAEYAQPATPDPDLLERPERRAAADVSLPGRPAPSSSPTAASA
jgi:hypothetical protein